MDREAVDPGLARVVRPQDRAHESPFIEGAQVCAAVPAQLFGEHPRAVPSLGLRVGQTSGVARSSRRSWIVAGDGFESPASLLPGDQMTGRMGEMLTGIAGELGAEEWGHQGDRGKAREWKESHADV